MEDWQLLNDYAARNSEEAFRVLAERYTAMVYHAALRQTGNPHTAEEITQAVFIALAQKATKIPKQTKLCGWLFRATRYAVLNHRRDDNCRRRHEQEAIDMENQTQTNPPDPVWEAIATTLDEALERLPKADREIVMIRFFGEKSHREVAEAMGLSEEAAKKRISRALDKLRLNFARRGVTVAAAALSASMMVNGAQAAPFGLSSSVAAVAVAKAPAAASAGSLATTIVKLMAWAKIKAVAIASVAVFFVAGTATVTVHQIYRHSAAYWDTPGLGPEVLGRAPSQVTIVPARYPVRPRAFVRGLLVDTNEPDSAQLLGVNVDLEGMLQFANRGRGLIHLTPSNMPTGRYDFIANLPTGSRSALADLIRQRYGYAARREARVFTNALAITLDRLQAAGLTDASTNLPDASAVGEAPNQYILLSSFGESIETELRDGKRILRDATLSEFAEFLTTALDTPVFDQSGLTNRYNFEFSLLAQAGDDRDSRIQRANNVILNELGLKLSPSTAPHDALIIQKVN